MQVVRDDDLAVRRHPHVELEHLRPALVDRAPEALQGVLVGLGRTAAVGNVNVAAPPLLQRVDSEIPAKGCMNSTDTRSALALVCRFQKKGWKVESNISTYNYPK